MFINTKVIVKQKKVNHFKRCNLYANCLIAFRLD